jgi:hypothetical protein
MAAPEIVRSARIEITASVFMGRSWFPIVAKSVMAWCIFETNRGNYRGGSRKARHIAIPTSALPSPFETTAAPSQTVDQRQPVEALAQSPREIVAPALGAQPAPLPDLLHGHAQNQDLMHQRRAVGAEFAIGAGKPHHRLALAFRDRLRHPPAKDIFACRIDRPRAARPSPNRSETPMTSADLQADRFDHAGDLKKHEPV